MILAPFLPVFGKIIRAARRVLRELGPGHPESLYHNALLSELSELGENVRRCPRLKVRYGQRVVGEVIPDILLRKGQIAVLIDCKAAARFDQADFDQMRRYLRAYDGKAAGLLLGFGGQRLEFRRVWLGKQELEEDGS